MNKLKSFFTGKNCILTGSVISILSIFMMFAPAINWVGSKPDINPSMFSYVFGISPIEHNIGGYTALFVFLCISIMLSVACIVFGCILKNDAPLVVFAIISGIISLVVLIVSFNTLNIITKVSGFVTSGNYLGVGPILLSISHIFVLLLNGFGVLLNFKN